MFWFAPVFTPEPHTLAWPLGGAGEICLGFADTYLIPCEQVSVPLFLYLSKMSKLKGGGIDCARVRLLVARRVSVPFHPLRLHSTPSPVTILLFDALYVGMPRTRRLP